MKILIATPCYGSQCFINYLDSMLKLQKYFIDNKIDYEVLTFAESLITRARNSYIAYFMSDKKFTHILFIDADIGFSVTAVKRLLEADNEVSGVAYPKKCFHMDAIRDYILKNPDVTETKKIISRNTEYIVQLNVDDNGRTEHENGFIKFNYLGTGFLMIKRTAIEKLIENHPELKYTNYISTYDELCKDKDMFYRFFDCEVHPVTKEYLSEDYAFCNMWRKLGGNIWVDITQSLAHTGTYTFFGSLSSKFSQT